MGILRVPKCPECATPLVPRSGGWFNREAMFVCNHCGQVCGLRIRWPEAAWRLPITLALTAILTKLFLFIPWFRNPDGSRPVWYMLFAVAVVASTLLKGLNGCERLVAADHTLGKTRGWIRLTCLVAVLVCYGAISGNWKGVVGCSVILCLFGIGLEAAAYLLPKAERQTGGDEETQG